MTYHQALKHLTIVITAITQNKKIENLWRRIAQVLWLYVHLMK
jgi:hypothetical protein